MDVAKIIARVKKFHTNAIKILLIAVKILISRY